MGREARRSPESQWKRKRDIEVEGEGKCAVFHFVFNYWIVAISWETSTTHRCAVELNCQCAAWRFGKTLNSRFASVSKLGKIIALMQWLCSVTSLGFYGLKRLDLTARSAPDERFVSSVCTATYRLFGNDNKRGLSARFFFLSFSFFLSALVRALIRLNFYVLREMK